MCLPIVMHSRNLGTWLAGIGFKYLRTWGCLLPKRRRYRVKEDDKWLPTRFYKSHLLHLPVATVDVVVANGESDYLLVKRSAKNLNWKGIWATPGGRVYRNERIRDAACRVLLRETGIRARPAGLRFCGVEEILTTKEHGVTMIFSLRTRQESPSFDETSSSLRWFSPRDLPKSLPRVYRSILRKAGVSARETPRPRMVTGEREPF